MEYVTLELDASEKGWRCSGCNLFTDCIGRPCFGNERWTIKTESNTWIENKPEYMYCPFCGKPVKGREHRG